MLARCIRAAIMFTSGFTLGQNTTRRLLNTLIHKSVLGLSFFG